jgi:hypothetical protein
MVFSSSSTQFVILPPPRQTVLNQFQNVRTDTRRHDQMFAEMQRFRGRIYASDGAMRYSDLTPDGRHKVEVDDYSWHVLSLDRTGRIYACVRYLEETRATGFDDLWVRRAAMTRSTEGPRFRAAVEQEMWRAREMRVAFGEVGGWAVAERLRGTLEPLRIILATYGLLELLGGCTGVATATCRHGSASMLRRIGLSSLMTDGAALPAYYDPHYQCEMEVLRFDSRFPNPKYRPAVQELASVLTSAPVIRRENIKTTPQEVCRGFEIGAAEPVLAPAGLKPSLAW